VSALRAGSAAVLVAGCVAAANVGCKAKASVSQCDQLLDRYAQLVVTERYPDASTDQVKAERDREKIEARGDDAFKNCSSQVSQAEFDCAMKAPTPDTFEKCLE
jgi:hypothetical protein